MALAAQSEVSVLRKGGWGALMEEYRAYIIGWDGHVKKRIDIRCPDEVEARRIAKIAVDGHAVELWQADHFIDRFVPEH